MEDGVLDSVERELALLVRRVTSISGDKSFASLDRSAYLLLGFLTARGPVGMTTVADQLHLDISTVSRQIASLEQKGLLVKRPDLMDRRAFILEITEKGRSAQREYKKARMARLTDILQDWSEEERRSFGHLLKKFNRVEPGA